MKEQNPDKREQQDLSDLDQRLSAYYGPQLQEQPLSSSSWQNLRVRLGTQERRGRSFRFRWRFPRTRSQADVPLSIQEAFARVAYEARMPYDPAMLRYSLNPRRRDPVVRVSWLGRYKIQLIMSLNAVTTMGQTELDVLLATGLARSIYARKPAYTLGRLLLLNLGIIACIALLLLEIQHFPLIGFPAAVMLCVGVVWLLHMQARSVAFHADTLMVFWLGREHVCNGLHRLADRSRAPQRRRWGEPSLAERIERVCGTRVESRDDQLTLVK